MLMQTQRPLYSDDDAIHLHDYISVLIRRKRAFIFVFVSIFLASCAYTFLMKPVYEANATLRVKEEKGRLSSLEELAFGFTSPVSAEIEILKSWTNAEKVVSRLHLDLEASIEKGKPSFRILEFTGISKGREFIITITGNGTFSIHDEIGDVIGSGQNGSLFQGREISILLDKLDGDVGDRFRLKAMPINRIVKALRENTIVEESPKQTNIIKLSYRHTDPEVAKTVANSLVQAYLEQTISYKAEEASRTVLFLEDQLENVKKELEISERNLEEFRRTTGVVLIDTESEDLIRKVSELEKDRALIKIQRKQAEFAIDSVEKALKHKTVYSPSVFKDDPIISSLATKLADMEVQKQSLLSEYTDSHPSVIKIQSEIDGILSKILSTYETSSRNHARQEVSISYQLNEYDSLLRGLPKKDRELARLNRLYKVNSDIYTFLLQKREESRIAKASTISNIDIVDPAIVPEYPVKPKVFPYLFIGVSLAAIMGSTAAFLLDYLDNTIKDPEMARRGLQMPLLAVIPFIPNTEEINNKDKHASLIAHYNPKSIITESFRSLRTSVHFSGVSKKRQVIMVTSSLPYEGKTTIVGNLAVILNQVGSRVLLLDCDLRRPSLHRLFGHSKSPGLTELLAGDSKAGDIIHATGIPGLDFISAGTIPPNPAELLGSESMKSHIIDFRSQYDHILIDAPPVLAVTDALLLSMLTDMVMQIVELRRVPIRAALHTRDVLQSIGAPLAGFVLNDKSEKGLEEYSYYGGKYYKYGYYGYGLYDEGQQGQVQNKRPFWRRLFRKRREGNNLT